MFERLNCLRFSALGAVCILIFALVGCDVETAGKKDSGSKKSSLEGTVAIDGSSTVFPISQAISSKFLDKFPKVTPTVGKSGTGGGFEEFVVGKTDISDASRPIKIGEFKKCQENKIEFIELPIAYDGLSICVNPKNEKVNQITREQLIRIFSAKNPVKKWNEIDPEWPDKEIKIYMPGTKSGTYDYFKEVTVDWEAKTKKIKNADGKFKGAIREDVSQSEEDNFIVQGISGEEFSIGFFGAAYYFQNQDKVKVVRVVNPDTKEPVAPSPESIEGGSYAPFSRPLFIYVNSAKLDRPEMRMFVEFYLDNVADVAKEVGYVALPQSLYDVVRKHYDDKVTGTHFWTKDGERRDGDLKELYTVDGVAK